jgi:hypothetical protein
MKRNIINGIILIGALALGSCSTTKLASNQLNKDDDVYFSKAKAGDSPEYVTSVQQQQNPNNYNNDDDYYYYDSYAARINRFNYLSPFGYYDNFYDGFYSPYYNSFNFGLGFGYGLGGYYGYSPYYSPFGYYGYGYYSPYSYYGTGYGGSPYWGIYSGSLSNNTPRPYRGSGAPNNAFVNRNAPSVGYRGNYPVNSNYPGRPTTVNSVNGRSTGNSSTSRPARTQAQPSYQPQPRVQSAPAPAPSPAPSNSGGGGYSGGGNSGGGGGGGGARPSRP